MKNLEVAAVLYEVADILELMEVQWEPRAYRNAARNIEALSDDVKELAKEGTLQDIPGVGKSIEQNILEILKTGTLKKLKDLKKKSKIDVTSLLKVPGMGPKTIKLLNKKLGVRNAKDLEKAAKQGKIKGIKGLGAKTEQSILDSLKEGFTKKARQPLGYIEPIAKEIEAALKKVKGITQLDVVGSYRRKKESVGDLDILVVGKQVKAIMDAFTSLPDIQKVLAKGSTRSAIRLSSGLTVDVRVVKPDEYGSALNYFTGSKEHGVALRQLAIKKGLKLSEYGVFNRKTNKKLAGASEKEVYKALGLPFIEPELRENLGEIEAAQKKQLPSLLPYGSIHADLQMHTTWSDGNNLIAEMAKECERLGHKVIAITDHLGPLKIANALDAKRFNKYLAAIEKANKSSNLEILKGAEIDILKDGTLSATKAQIKQLDYVLVAVHSSFKMSKADMTKRIITALENNPVTTLAHPTTRRLGKRGPLDLDFDKLFEVAKATDTFLEIDCHPLRMDLNGPLIKAGMEAGCKFAVGSDSHAADQLHFISQGEGLARRGWLGKKHVLNAWTKPKILKEIKKATQ